MIKKMLLGAGLIGLTTFSTSLAAHSHCYDCCDYYECYDEYYECCDYDEIIIGDEVYYIEEVTIPSGYRMIYYPRPYDHYIYEVDFCDCCYDEVRFYDEIEEVVYDYYDDYYYDNGAVIMLDQHPVRIDGYDGYRVISALSEGTDSRIEVRTWLRAPEGTYTYSVKFDPSQPVAMATYESFILAQLAR